MYEQAAEYQPDQHSLRMVGGGWCRVEDDRVHLLADDGDVTRTVDLTDVVAVRRGGADLTLVRRAADPISFTLTEVDHARTFESAVEEIISTRIDHEEEGNGPHHWWQFWKRF